MRLIGMIHLAPLPGSPRFDGDLDGVLSAALIDAHRLADAGFVPKVTVSAMTRAIAAISDAVDLPVGVNVLRNDALAALAIAAATGAAFIRVNVLSGSMSTDQGTITGRAAEVARLRAATCPQVEVLADVFVKHAAPPPGLSIEQAAHDLAERGGADAIVVSGTGTGHPVDENRMAAVRKAVPDTRLYAGSGVDALTVGEILAICDGVIVGTAIKEGGVTTAPVDPERARALVEAAG
jgi:membrane complex biogenesis BtpA family protein